jgi:hypothetical protein
MIELSYWELVVLMLGMIGGSIIPTLIRARMRSKVTVKVPSDGKWLLLNMDDGLITYPSFMKGTDDFPEKVAVLTSGGSTYVFERKGGKLQDVDMEGKFLMPGEDNV